MLRNSLPAAAAIAALFAFALPAQAFEHKAYDAAAVQAAADAGKPYLLHVSAPWCPTCTAQGAAFKTLDDKPELAAVTIFKVDFDSEKDALEKYGVRTQSTVIAFKGATETGRLIGETKPAPLEKLATTTLEK